MPKTELVSDLNRQVQRTLTHTGRRVSARAKSAGQATTLESSDEQATPRPHTVPAPVAGLAANGNTEDAGRSLVIVRTYDPAGDLDQRLSRIYGLLSLPPIRSPEDTGQ